MTGEGNTLYMEEQSGLKLVPRTGPCLARGGLETTSSNGWDICPVAESCERAKDPRVFDIYCSSRDKHFACEEFGGTQ